MIDLNKKITPEYAAAEMKRLRQEKENVNNLPYQIAGRILEKYLRKNKKEREKMRRLYGFARAYHIVSRFPRTQAEIIYKKNLIELVDEINEREDFLNMQGVS